MERPQWVTALLTGCTGLCAAVVVSAAGAGAAAADALYAPPLLDLESTTDRFSGRTIVELDEQGDGQEFNPTWTFAAGGMFAFGSIQALRSSQTSAESITVVQVQMAVRGEHRSRQQRLFEMTALLQEARPGRQGLWMMLEEVERSERDVVAVDVSTLRVPSRGEAMNFIDLTAAHERETAAASAQLHPLHNSTTATAPSPPPPATVATPPPATAAEEDSVWAQLLELSTRPVLSALTGDWAGDDGGGGGGKAADEGAMVLTLLVAVRGSVDASARTIVSGSWRDASPALQELRGLSPDRLVAIQLLWSPHTDAGLPPAQLLGMYPHLATPAYRI